MGASASATSNSDFSQPLVVNNSVNDPPLETIYGAIEEKISDSRYIGNSSLLDPSGHLSQELQAILDDEFMKYSNGLLVMARNELKKFLIACYPQLMTNEHDYYDDRVNYILSRYGKPFKDVRNHFAKILNITLSPQSNNNNVKNKNDNNNNNDINNNDNSMDNDGMSVTKKNSMKIEEDWKEREARIVKESLMSQNVSSSSLHNRNDHSHHNSHHNGHNGHNQTEIGSSASSGTAVSIEEDENVIEKTIDCQNISENEIVLPKTKFLLFYRKSCFDREMMVRLELTELGYQQFRAMLVDRSKSVDVLAYKVQQLRNQEDTHLEEKNRILNAISPKQSANDIINYINLKIDPFDNNNDNDNLYRKRRPIKFGSCCYHCCPCIVCVARCCCG